MRGRRHEQQHKNRARLCHSDLGPCKSAARFDICRVSRLLMPARELNLPRFPAPPRAATSSVSRLVAPQCTQPSRIPASVPDQGCQLASLQGSRVSNFRPLELSANRGSATPWQFLVDCLLANTGWRGSGAGRHRKCLELKMATTSALSLQSTRP